MPGPMPKPAALRQRRNKATTRAMLPAEVAPITRRPSLPANPLGDWHKLTLAWWDDVWSSPMRGEFMRADLGALFRLAMLTDTYWKSGKLAIAKEIRLLEREFGLTPLSRRRLEWSVAVADDATERADKQRAGAARVIDGKASDPREVLGG